MSAAALWQVPLIVLVVAALAAVPLVANGYQLALGISIMIYAVLATAWALFSGPTRYISLATVAFFGIGAYTVAVSVGDAAGAGGHRHRRGDRHRGRAGGRPLHAAAPRRLFRHLHLRPRRADPPDRRPGTRSTSPARSAATSSSTSARSRSTGSSSRSPCWCFFAGWLIRRSRLGLALRVIGDDETVARHVAIDTTAAKLILFAVSAAFMSVTGAVMAPRWTYIDPAIAFNPLISFQVVIMALLGGAERLCGPLLGVDPAGAPVRGAHRQLPELLRHPARHRLHRHRLLPARRRGRARRPLAGRAPAPAGSQGRAAALPGTPMLERQEPPQGLRRPGRGRRCALHRRRAARSSA